MRYTLSIIREYGIKRLNYVNKDDAVRAYNFYYKNMQYGWSDVVGVQLWKSRQGKTIDNDGHAKIIKQDYK